EAIERFCEKVITACEHLGAASKNPDQPRRRRQRTSPSEHYYIAKHPRASYDLTSWLVDLGEDPAIENFTPQLKDHLLARLRNIAYDGDEHDFSDEDRDSVLITDN
ncbi:hypothetical protein M405DRAFT_732044, partial [Rhizopogon salebrosus TDB-379]